MSRGRRTRKQWAFDSTRSFITKAAPPHWRRLRFEPLEDRRLLSITVDTLIDVNAIDGMTTLREAIAVATAGETIDFSVTGTINLSSLGQLTIDKSLTIQGPGANLLTIKAYDPTAAVGDGARIFDLNDNNASTQLDVAISGLTLTGGDVGGAGISGSGGAILNRENLTLIESTISGNSAGSRGGGIYNAFGHLTVTGSTISGNSAVEGGGIASDTDLTGMESSTITNSTISGNSAVGRGGGVWNIDGRMIIRHTTIAANTAPAGWGSGVASFGDIFTLTEVYSSIIAGNTNSDVDFVYFPINSFASLGYNLIGTGNATGEFVEPGDQTSVTNPMLGTLADNGGPTKTHALLMGSPAIDVGNPAVVFNPAEFDQRGNPFVRVFDGDEDATARIDIGSYERQTVDPSNFVVDTLVDEDDGDYSPGDRSLREVIGVAHGSVGAETITFDAALGGGTITLTLGELIISDAMTINGLGADLLTIDASGNDPTPAVNNGDGSRVFNIDDGNNLTHQVVLINGLTLSGGDVTGSGGGIANAENLTLSASSVSGNAATLNGGGIDNYNHNGFSDMTLSGTTVSNNFASYGGGVSGRYADLTISGSTINANQVTGGGGGIKYFHGTVTVSVSTISGNTSSASGGGIHGLYGILTVNSTTISGNSAIDGAGIWFLKAAAVVNNSIVSGNSASDFGGGLYASEGTLTVNYSTITDNDAIDGGGGIFDPPIFSGSISLAHTIVAGNRRSAGVRSDIIGEVTASYSLIGDNTSAFINNNGGNLIGTGGSPISPLLGLLADNGGPTKTHALLAGSPAIDMGDPAIVFNPTEFDQRGDPFVRVFDSDGAGGARIDMGAYERQSVAGLSLIVDTLVDESDGDYLPGDLSLREAVSLANGSVGANTITFAAALTTGGPASIVLTQGELRIVDDLTIDGPGANQLSIDASGNDPTPTLNNGDGSRVLNIDNGSAGVKIFVEIVGVTLTGGDVTGSGGGIRTSTEDLSIVASVISDNAATSGGGIHSFGGIGTVVTVTSSTISGNAAATGGGLRSIGGDLTVASSTISGNSASTGGGINSESTSVRVTDSTISGNTATSSGGGISTLYGGVFLAHSTITGNVADADGNNSGQGGGIAGFSNPYYPSVNVELDHTIVAGNIRGISARSDINGLVGNTRCSLIGDRTGATGIIDQGGNLIGTSGSPIDPLLGPLADNGGPTMTHALFTGSPAIDMGDAAAVAGVLLVPLFDQRGEPFSRVYDGDGVAGARIDMGAVERQPIPSAFFGDYNQNEVVDAADYVVWRKTIGNIIAAYSGADGSGNGSVGQEDYGVWRTHFGQELPPPGAGSGAAATAFGESTVQELDTAEPVPLETPHSEAHANTVKQIALGLFDARPMRRGANYAPRKQVNTFHITDPAEKLIFLLANDRVGPSSRQVLSLVDDQGSDDDPAEEMDSPCLTDDPLSVALAEWR